MNREIFKCSFELQQKQKAGDLLFPSTDSFPGEKLMAAPAAW